ncbi:MAG: hypothetical protein ACRBEE_09495 [Arenicella sp.]
MFKEKKWSNRIQLILLFLIFFAPLSGAYYCIYFSEFNCQGEATNMGELYLPKPLDLDDATFIVAESDGSLEEVKFNEFESRWYLLVLANDQCDVNCEKNLEKIGYVKTILARYAGRIESALAYHGLEAERVQELQKKYSLIAMNAADKQSFEKWLKPFYEGRQKAEIDMDRIYVIDPVKKLMMSYPLDAQPIDDIYEDMKRLLKTSRVG